MLMFRITKNLKILSINFLIVIYNYIIIKISIIIILLASPREGSLYFNIHILVLGSPTRGYKK